MNEREVIKGVIKIPNPNFNPELEVGLENPKFIALPTIKGEKGEIGPEGPQGLKGEKGEPGQIENLELAHIESALGYIPAAPYIAGNNIMITEDNIINFTGSSLNELFDLNGGTSDTNFKFTHDMGMVWHSAATILEGGDVYGS